MSDILIIEDNLEISRLLLDFLKKEGYSCFSVRTGEEGLDYLDQNTVRLVILDITLPRMDGFQVCSEIHHHRNIPTLILSAKTEKEDKIMGLELGADDYMEKPYDIDLLIAKVNALYRRHYSSDSTGLVTVGEIRIETNARKVFVREQSIDVTVKEYELLLLLMENSGKTMNKNYLFDKVWGADSFSEPSTLTVHIKWLRDKIERNPKSPKYIQTVWGVGYRFDGGENENKSS